MTAANARLVFVYGSLLAGEENHARLGGAPFVGPARTEPAFDLLDLGEYPTLARGGVTVVLGEVYAVPADVLSALDAFEAPYRRGGIRLEDGRRVDAYLLPPELAASGPCIPSGSWRAHRARPVAC